MDPRGNCAWQTIYSRCYEVYMCLACTMGACDVMFHLLVDTALKIVDSMLRQTCNGFEMKVLTLIR